MAMVRLRPQVMLALASSRSHLAAVLVAPKELAPLYLATAGGGKPHNNIVQQGPSFKVLLSFLLAAET